MKVNMSEMKNTIVQNRMLLFQLLPKDLILELSYQLPLNVLYKLIEADIIKGLIERDSINHLYFYYANRNFIITR